MAVQCGAEGCGGCCARTPTTATSNSTKIQHKQELVVVVVVVKIVVLLCVGRTNLVLLFSGPRGSNLECWTMRAAKVGEPL